MTDCETLEIFFEKTKDHIDRPTFEQILEMDDDDASREFSRGIISEFLDQIDNTTESMEREIKNKNLSKLSELGHYLKGSSATLGLTRIRDQCQKIQDLRAVAPAEVPMALKDIQDSVEAMKKDLASLQSSLKILYGDVF